MAGKSLCFCLIGICRVLSSSWFVRLDESTGCEESKYCGIRSPRVFKILSGQQLAIMTSNAQLQGIILHIFRFFARIGRQTHQNVSIPKNPKILELILCFEASDAQSSFKKRTFLKKS